MSVLQDGGNAVDAAIATGLALAVTLPHAGNIGGGGFMVVRDPSGEAVVVDYREAAPRKLTPEHLLDDGKPTSRSTFGALSVAVPGTIAGFGAALERFGSWPWGRIVERIIGLAADGFWQTARQASYVEKYREDLSCFESTLACYGSATAPAKIFRQPLLAKTLKDLGTNGPSCFYTGALADRIVAGIARAGGVLDGEDLAAYQPIWREPHRRTFLGREVITPSLPSAGGLELAVALGLIEAFEAHRAPALSIKRLVLLGRAFRVSAGLRLKYAADPAAVPAGACAEAARFAEMAFSRKRLAAIEREILSNTHDAVPLAEQRKVSTTYFAVLDREGRAVSNTYSLNTTFGSKLAVEGFLLNNSIDDFRIGDACNWYRLVQGDQNRLAPGRRPASSMGSAIVVNKGRVELVAGGSGGPRIPSSVAQVILSVIGDGATLATALAQPRVHHQHSPDVLWVETALRDAVKRGLARQFEIEEHVSLGVTAGLHRAVGESIFSAGVDPRLPYP